MHRTTKLCVLTMIALALCGCDDAPLGFMDVEGADGTVTRVSIDRTSAWHELPPAGTPDDVRLIHVLLVGWDDDQRPYALQVTLEPPNTRGSDEVAYCDAPILRCPICARTTDDGSGERYSGHLVRREPDGDGEIVHAWGRFADDGVGPRSIHATFHFDPSTVVPFQPDYYEDAP